MKSLSRVTFSEYSLQVIGNGAFYLTAWARFIFRMGSNV